MKPPPPPDMGSGGSGKPSTTGSHSVVGDKEVRRHGFPGYHAVLGQPCGDPCVGGLADSDDTE